MEIKMMCPKCLGENFTHVENDKFICDKCGKHSFFSQMVYESKYYVYAFINDDWNVPFYVGKGSYGRYKDMKGRSKHIQSICSNFNWHPEIIRYCNSEKEAYLYESDLKKEYKNIGYPIIDGEVNIIHKEAVRSGIERAKQNGKYQGRKPVCVDLYEFVKLYKEVKDNERTNTNVMKKLGLTRTTYYKILDEYKTRTGRFKDFVEEITNEET